MKSSEEYEQLSRMNWADKGANQVYATLALASAVLETMKAKPGSSPLIDPGSDQYDTMATLAKENGASVAQVLRVLVEEGLAVVSGKNEILLTMYADQPELLNLRKAIANR